MTDPKIITLEGDDKDKFLDGLRQASGMMPKDEALETWVCANCKERIRTTATIWRALGQPGEKGAIYSEAGAREYRISAVCETCFDAMFGGTE